MTISRRTLLGSATAAGATIALPGVLRAQEATINAVHFTPAQVGYAQSFLKFAAKVNEKGKGIVQIRVRGGPEVIPFGQLGESQRTGAIDMINAPAGAYLNLVPEGEAFNITTKKPAELKANGGFDLINQVYNRKGNAQLLAHVDGGRGFHVFCVDEPAQTTDGSFDWKKLKVRAAPLQRDFMESLGCNVVVMGPAEVYTALERGLVNSTCYTILGYKAFGWNKFTKFRIDPDFFQTDVLISMNKAKWDSLSAEAKKVLADVSAEHEASSIAENVTNTENEDKQLQADGMKILKMSDAAGKAFQAKATQVSLERMTKRDPANVEALRAKFL
ncbi:MAG TPA: TRAP transporter substrate-binding protein DctP [Beijerinckiaceae bacterium]|nr:TRAP transporter substrate-binding protein DctP [Beijerinckiaceae bacterium]